MAALKASVNVFALLESNDPGDTRLADLRAPTKAEAAASQPVNINKKQQPQMSVWKANKLKKEANAAAKNKKQQPAAASKAKTNTAANAGRNRKPQPQPQPAAPKAQVVGTTANAGEHKRPPPPPQQQQQQAAASKVAQVNTAANAAAINKPPFQSQQQPPAPANLTQILFGNSYPSARALIYKNRKPNAPPPANAKDGVDGAAPAEDKKGGKPNGAAVKDAPAPAPVEEEPPAPVKPVLSPPPPPSLNDSAQFPSLK